MDDNICRGWRYLRRWWHWRFPAAAMMLSIGVDLARPRPRPAFKAGNRAPDPPQNASENGELPLPHPWKGCVGYCGNNESNVPFDISYPICRCRTKLPFLVSLAAGKGLFKKKNSPLLLRWTVLKHLVYQPCRAPTRQSALVG